MLFVAPEWSAANFAWSVSPTVMMTIGAWCLGTAAHAWDAARVWRWSIVHPSLVYLWSFGVLEAMVLILFRERLLLNGIPAWLYLSALSVNVIAAVAGVLDVLRLRPQVHVEGVAAPLLLRVAVIAFVPFAGLIALGAAVAGAAGAVSQGGFFPDQMTLFTIRAFASFYAAVALGAAPLIWARGVGPIVRYGRDGLAFVVTITAAALFHFDKFDFAARPGGALYLGVYVVLFFSAIILLLRYRNASR
jgi:hypothetical protein